jgi:hypothetical protein
VSGKGITSDRSEIGVTWRFWVRSAFKALAPWSVNLGGGY